MASLWRCFQVQTHVSSSVPTIYTGLLRNEKFRKMNLSFVKGYFDGAAPLPEDTLSQLSQLHGATSTMVRGD